MASLYEIPSLLSVSIGSVRFPPIVRMARFVLPGAPHHGTQRGNRRERIFVADDFELYKYLLGARFGRDPRPKKRGPKPQEKSVILILLSNLVEIKLMLPVSRFPLLLPAPTSSSRRRDLPRRPRHSTSRIQAFPTPEAGAISAAPPTPKIIPRRSCRT